MNRQDVREKYPATYKVFCDNEYRIEIVEGLFLDREVRDINLLFSEIRQPTWAVCEKYLNNKELFEEDFEGNMIGTYMLTDIETHLEIVVYCGGFGVYVHLPWTRDDNDDENRLFSYCIEYMRKIELEDREAKTQREKEAMREHWSKLYE